MKWIPAVIVLAMFNCEQGEAPPAPEPGQTAAEVAPADAGAAATPDAAAEAVVPEDPSQFSQPFLWKVYKKDGNLDSYLYGTVNAKLDIEFDRAPLNVRQALTMSSYAMFEAPTGSAGRRDRTKLMAMKTGSARKELGSKHFKDLVKYTGQKSRVLDVMKPWVAYIALEEKYAGDPPMEELFEGFAQSYRKRIVYLETVSEQVDILEANLDWELLRGIIDEFEAHDASAKTVVDAYAVGDGDKVLAALFPPDDKRAEYFRKLNEARAESWASKLDAQFSKHATFAVVDVRYLIGPTNVVDALKAKGWIVKRLE